MLGYTQKIADAAYAALEQHENHVKDFADARAWHPQGTLGRIAADKQSKRQRERLESELRVAITRYVEHLRALRRVRPSDMLVADLYRVWSHPHAPNWAPRASEIAQWRTERDAHDLQGCVAR